MQPHGGDRGGRNRIKKNRLGQQGMAHAAVTPVQQCQIPSIAAKIAWMEVAVDQRVLKTASGHIVEAAGKPAYKVRERYAILRGDFLARPLDHVSDRSAKRRPAPIR